MNNKYKNTHIRKFSFIAITLLYLMVFENNLCGSANHSHASTLTNVEVIYQLEFPKEFQPYENSLSLKQRKAYVTFYLENIFKCRKKLLLSANFFLNCYFNNQQRYSSPFHRFISILQKNNPWHQFSDDDPFHSNYC